MLGNLGPVEYQSCAKWAMEFLGWTEDKKLTKDEEYRFQQLVFSRARSMRYRLKHTIEMEPPKAVFGKIVSELPAPNPTPIHRRLMTALEATKAGARGKAEYKIGPYYADIAYPDVRLCVECDGRDYHTSPSDRERDERRNNYMAKLGWKVRRFRGRDIHHAVQACVEIVLADLKALGANLD